jgi:hypothetical protein
MSPETIRPPLLPTILFCLALAAPIWVLIACGAYWAGRRLLVTVSPTASGLVG